MPIVFIVIGILFLVVAIRGTQGELYDVLKSELTGSNNWVVWASAIVILGLIGYWRRARPVTDAFIGLIFIVLVIANKGFFAKFNQGLRAPSTAQGTSGSVDALLAPTSASGTQTASNALGTTQMLSGPAAPPAPSAPTANTSGSGGLVNVYDNNGQWTGLADPSFVQ